MTQNKKVALEQRGVSRRAFLAQSTSIGALAILGGFGATARAGGLPVLKPVSPGVLTIAMDGDMPRTGVKDGAIIGADGEMISFIAKRLGLTPKPALMDWASTIESVRTGRADLVLGNMGWTPARAQVVALTDPLYYTGHYVLTRAAMPVGAGVSIEQFKGRTVGTLTGVTIVPELKRIPGTTDVKLYDTSDACISDIRAGRLDFAFLDGPIVGYMMAQNTSWNLKLVPITPFPGFAVLGTKQYSVIGMNGDNPDLFDAVNAGVQWFWHAHAAGKVLSKYGMSSPAYLVPPSINPRLNIDRDAAGQVIGKWAHATKDFAPAFLSASA